MVTHAIQQKDRAEDNNENSYHGARDQGERPVEKFKMQFTLGNETSYALTSKRSHASPTQICLLPLLSNVASHWHTKQVLPALLISVQSPRPEQEFVALVHTSADA